MAELTFTLIQSDLHWENPEENRAMLQEKIESIQEKKQVVILPEMFSTGFSMNPSKLGESMEGPTISWMKEQAAKHKMILCGSLIIKEDDKYYNRFLWVLPSGQIQSYDKRHLFSYAGEDAEFMPGEQRIIVQANGWRILLQVCYDLRFPVYARQQKADEYDAIIYVANWPKKRMTAWDTLLRARAIENQCFTIGVNRTGTDGLDFEYDGSSSIYDPMGEPLYNKKGAEDIITMTLNNDEVLATREKLPFQKDKDSFSL